MGTTQENIQSTTFRPRGDGASTSMRADSVAALSAAANRLSRAVQQVDERQLARALGWFSIGLGLAQILAPRTVGRAIGVGDYRWIMRACGIREVVSGVGILTQRQPAPWLWSRVGGDAVDLALLGTALVSPNSQRGRVAATVAAVGGVTALDVVASRRLDYSAEARGGPLHVRQSIAIDRPPDELYAFWRDFSNLAHFMKHIEEVRVIDQRRSNWRVKGPAGTSVEWESEIMEERPGELISWRSVEGADVDNSGVVRFEPMRNRRGTLVHVEMRYTPPAGAAGAAVAKLFGKAPDQEMRQDLRRLKQLLETGEIATTAGQPSGRRSVISGLFTRGEQS